MLVITDSWKYVEKHLNSHILISNYSLKTKKKHKQKQKTKTL